MPHIELGPVPAEEPCAQLGREGYEDQSRDEMRRYATLLGRAFPNRPEGCRFVVKRFNHDFGAYGEVCVTYSDSSVEEVNFAFDCESSVPGTWAELEAMAREAVKHDPERLRRYAISDARCRALSELRAAGHTAHRDALGHVVVGST